MPIAYLHYVFIYAVLFRNQIPLKKRRARYLGVHHTLVCICEKCLTMTAFCILTDSYDVLKNTDFFSILLPVCQCRQLKL